MAHDPSTLRPGLDPTDADVDAWAARERRRREQWAHGPTPEQAALWAVRERERRTFEQEPLSPPHAGPPARGWPLRRRVFEVRLAAMGALRLAVNMSMRDAIEYLMQVGLDWEEELSRHAETECGAARNPASTPPHQAIPAHSVPSLPSHGSGEITAKQSPNV